MVGEIGRIPDHAECDQSERWFKLWCAAGHDGIVPAPTGASGAAGARVSNFIYEIIQIPVSQDTSLFPRLVLGCINTDFGN